uniref:Putative secreted protein n=1 Tax=Anopheles darlingi TaxID=43151 RepID=A0A2M4DIZ1_ANODA
MCSSPLICCVAYLLKISRSFSVAARFICIGFSVIGRDSSFIFASFVVVRVPYFRVVDPVAPGCVCRSTMRYHRGLQQQLQQ